MPGVADSIFAPERFFPRIKTRTGSIVLPVHQLGGSIFSTTGACAIIPSESESRHRQSFRVAGKREALLADRTVISASWQRFFERLIASPIRFGKFP
jgi:hypothetical protein